MAHESFEDSEIAELLSKSFISIKVDREERPDIDGIYMQAVVSLTGQGGWPLTVFLTPSAVPFWGGTYFPPTPRQGFPSFRQVLMSIADAYANSRDDVADAANRMKLLLSRADNTEAPNEPSHFLLNTIRQTLISSVDRINGGWGGAPKFPQPMVLDFLLRYHHRTNDTEALAAVEQSLQKMAAGGIYDQLGGGFHRYSTDEVWLVPHFEKMLYDNAQLARVYLKAWQVTGNTLYRDIVEATLDYIAREMTDSHGGFYSSQDADTNGEEGLTFVWSIDEIRTVLGENSTHFATAYGVSSRGNFEGHNILHRPISMDEAAALGKLSLTDSETQLAADRTRLFEVRQARPQPGRDDKIITAWNGLMLAAFAEAGRFLGRNDYLIIAKNNADFLLSELVTSEYRVLRTWKDGRARLNGYLEDYSHLAEGLLATYEALFVEDYFIATREIANQLITHFSDPQGGFYETSNDHETLITRPHSDQDNAVASGGSMSATLLHRLASMSGESHYSDAAMQATSRLVKQMENYPTSYGQWLVALEYHFANPREIAIIGDSSDPLRAELLKVVNSTFHPAQVVAAGPQADITPLPLLRGRIAIDGRPTAYVCHNFLCETPVTDPDVLTSQLNP